MLRRLGALCGPSLIFVVSGMPSSAGPPFNADFAAPIGYGEAELDFYAQSTKVQGDTSATLPGAQLDYGVAPNTQLRIALPFSYDKSERRPAQYGFGDLELGLKYRFIDRSGEDWWPQVAVFPLLLTPSGSSRRGLGQGHMTFALPIWLQKDLGRWTVYGGGGYAIEAGQGNENSWFAGVAALRQITDRFALGGEIFYKERTRIGQPSGTTISLGGSYDMTERYHVYFSVSRGIQNASVNNEMNGYLSLAITF